MAMEINSKKLHKPALFVGGITMGVMLLAVLAVNSYQKDLPTDARAVFTPSKTEPVFAPSNLQNIGADAGRYLSNK